MVKYILQTMGYSFLWRLFFVEKLENLWYNNTYLGGRCVMLGLTRYKLLLIVLVIAVLFLLPGEAYASGTFGSLTGAGKTIFQGLKKIIYPASAIGIICICIGGFFGNINWKWLMAIIIGLFVISACAAFISFFTPDGVKPDLG